MAVEGLPEAPPEGKKSRAKRSWSLEKDSDSGHGGGDVSSPRRRGCPQKNAETLSSQYGLHLFLAGLLLQFAWAVHAEGISKSALLAYLTTLMLLQILWMAWYLCRHAAHRRLIRGKDAHAGARWLNCESGLRGTHAPPFPGHVFLSPLLLFLLQDVSSYVLF